MILIEWLKAYFEFPLWKELGPIFGNWIAISLLLCAALTLYAVIKKLCELAKRLIVWLFTGKDPDKLCAVCVGGWISAVFFIDHEDIFAHHIPENLANRKVGHDYWDKLSIVDAQNKPVEIPCHYIEVSR